MDNRDYVTILRNIKSRFPQLDHIGADEYDAFRNIVLNAPSALTDSQLAVVAVMLLEDTVYRLVDDDDLFYKLMNEEE